MYKYFFILTSLLAIFLILNTVRNRLLSISESFFWICGGLGMLIISIFPSIIDNLSMFFGISYPPSLLFLFAILFLIFINFRHSKLITYQREQIIELAQNIALLKENKNSKK